jgi:hypothetical protein
MTYQSPFHNTIGVSGPGFASRGKASHIKRLSVAPPSQISTIDETEQANIGSTPRTSRGHMLAGLRTAPKSAIVSSSDSGFGLEGSRYASPQHSNNNRGVPQTASGAFFPGAGYNNNSFNQAMYLRPDQILAPPAIQINNHGGQFDQGLYGELLATNARLAQQQRELQQQLANITAAAQQFDSMSLSPTTTTTGQQALQSPVGSHVHFLSEQGYQVSPVPGSPGMFAVFNPFTGAENYVFDNSMQQPQTFAAPDPAWSPTGSRSHTRSPPKSSPSPPQDVERLPSPSATAFRRGHNKALSSVTGNKGPGQSRTGEHPLRQPRGPPLLQELQEKPTSKFEGSKNFVIRQRRRAVNDLMRAGFARTGF